MIDHNPTKPLKIVLLSDPEIACEDLSVIMKYGRTRDVSLLDVDLDSGTMRKTGKPVAIVTVLPLNNDLASLKDGGYPGRMGIVQTHVTFCQNISNVKTRMGDRGHMELTEESMDYIPQAVVEEIANVSIQLGEGIDGAAKAFFLADGLQRQINRLPLAPVKPVLLKSAETTKSPSDSDQKVKE